MYHRGRSKLNLNSTYFFPESQSHHYFHVSSFDTRRSMFSDVLELGLALAPRLLMPQSPRSVIGAAAFGNLAGDRP